MNFRLIGILLSAGAIIATSALAQDSGPNGPDGSIGVYIDNMGTNCAGTVAGVATLHIVARFNGRTSDGITGAELRTHGWPVGWQVFANPNPASTANVGSVVGVADPTVNGGANIAFPMCQAGTAGTLSLFTLTVIASSSVAAEIVVDQKTPPGNPNLPCQAMFLCDSPIFTQVCVNSGHAYLNGQPTPGTCVVIGVEAETWTAVKSLYH